MTKGNWTYIFRFRYQPTNFLISRNFHSRNTDFEGVFFYTLNIADLSSIYFDCTPTEEFFIGDDDDSDRFAFQAMSKINKWIKF